METTIWPPRNAEGNLSIIFLFTGRHTAQQIVYLKYDISNRSQDCNTSLVSPLWWVSRNQNPDGVSKISGQWCNNRDNTESSCRWRHPAECTIIQWYRRNGVCLFDPSEVKIDCPHFLSQRARCVWSIVFKSTNIQQEYGQNNNMHQALCSLLIFLREKMPLNHSFYWIWFQIPFFYAHVNAMSVPFDSVVILCKGTVDSWKFLF